MDTIKCIFCSDSEQGKHGVVINEPWDGWGMEIPVCRLHSATAPAIKQCCVVRDSMEWLLMWSALYALAINAGVPDKQTATTPEVWQYMGTWWTTHEGQTAYFHQFRHRYHPVTNKREYVNIPVSEGFKATE